MNKEYLYLPALYQIFTLAKIQEKNCSIGSIPRTKIYHCNYERMNETDLVSAFGICIPELKIDILIKNEIIEELEGNYFLLNGEIVELEEDEIGMLIHNGEYLDMNIHNVFKLYSIHKDIIKKTKDFYGTWRFSIEQKNLITTCDSFIFTLPTVVINFYELLFSNNFSNVIEKLTNFENVSDRERLIMSKINIIDIFPFAKDLQHFQPR